MVDVFTKCAWVKPLKDKKGKIFLDGFIEIVNKYNHKQNKLWFDQREECYSNLMQKS